MAHRKSSRSSRRPHRGGRRRSVARAVLVFQLLVALLIGGWYLFQPPLRQAEVRRLVKVAISRDKAVSPLDVAVDLWNRYYGDAFVAAAPPGEHDLLYGGAPVLVPGGVDARLGSVHVLKNQAYVVGYSDELGVPLWAGYHLADRSGALTAPERPDRFVTDDRTLARVSTDVYNGSGFDRGHMAPNFAIGAYFGPKAQDETFLLSNVVPQRHSLNAELWRSLEQKIARSYTPLCGEVWVLCGPVFDGGLPRRVHDAVAVPDAFFLVVVDEDEGRVRALALLVPQDAPASADPEQYLTSIDEIQRRTGLDLLSGLDAAAERALEAHKETRLW